MNQPRDSARSQAPTSIDSREARFARLLYRWWLDEQPAWTERAWWDAPLREDVRALLWVPAGHLLGSALAAIGDSSECPEPHLGEGPLGQPAMGHARGWPCACQVVVAAAWQACAGWAAAGSTTSLVHAAGPEPVVIEVPATGQHITDPAREELATALRLSPGSMGNRITAARELAAHPRLLALVASAAISPWAARSVVMEVTDLTDEQSAAVVEDVCSKITSRQSSGRRSWTSAEVGRAARMTRRRRCPDTDRETRERAFHRRRVQVLPDKNGMAFLVADLDEIHAHRIHRRLTAITRGLSDAAESRTHDQIRADVLVDLLLGAPLQGARAGGTQPSTQERRIEEPSAHDHAHGHGPGRGQDQGPDEHRSVTAGEITPTEGIPTVDLPGRSKSLPEIQVVVSWETLLGMSSEPGMITGLGPIGAEVARELAADGRWRAWITDSSGAVIATGSSTYAPSPRVARIVRAREPYCRMPGCRRPAETCDLDHTVAYPQGTTSVGNLGPLCRRHHNLKTHLGWQLEPLQPQRASGHALPDPPPGWRWRTPAGIKITEQTAPPLE